MRLREVSDHRSRYDRRLVAARGRNARHINQLGRREGIPAIRCLMIRNLGGRMHVAKLDKIVERLVPRRSRIVAYQKYAGDQVLRARDDVFA